MICIIAMIVFGIISIFSASYRPIAKESFDCVFRRVTLRKCQSGLDIKLKTKLVGKIMNKSPTLAKPVYKYFEMFSWLFVIITIVSLFFTGQAVYNLVVYDNCAGPNANPEDCIFVPDSIIVDCEDPLCREGNCTTCGDNCTCNNCNQ